MLLGVCLPQLIQRANLHEKWETIMGGSHFLLPCGAQYDDNLLPQLIRPWNHRSLLMDPIMAQPYPMVEVGSFMMQDPLFPSTAGDSYVYWEDARKWLEERGYRILKYTGPGPEVPLTISTSTIMPTSGANDAIMQGGMPEPDSILPQQQQPLGPLPRTSCQHPKVECTTSVKRANLPAVKSKRRGWMTPTAPGQLSPLLGMEAHPSEASSQLPSMCPNSPPCPGRQRPRLGHIPSPGIAIYWLAPMIRRKSSQQTSGGHFIPLCPFPASQGPN